MSALCNYAQKQTVLRPEVRQRIILMKTPKGLIDYVRAGEITQSHGCPIAVKGDVQLVADWLVEHVGARIVYSRGATRANCIGVYLGKVGSTMTLLFQNRAPSEFCHLALEARTPKVFKAVTVWLEANGFKGSIGQDALSSFGNVRWTAINEQLGFTIHLVRHTKPIHDPGITQGTVLDNRVNNTSDQPPDGGADLSEDYPAGKYVWVGVEDKKVQSVGSRTSFS
ncbi:MAG: hypothetical protein QG568_520 [Patescibacteria group bacterium]|nr:hypothetical protein [Patescibacteria group bacterium]